MNPWLALPLEDYEGHMGSDAVNQLAPLADLFGEALARLRPRSVAILGVAGGNGLQHVDGTITTRVVGIDVNPDYLTATRERFPDLRGSSSSAPTSSTTPSRPSRWRSSTRPSCSSTRAPAGAWRARCRSSRRKATCRWCCRSRPKGDRR